MTGTVRAMTFNVRVAVDEGRQAWERRRDDVASVIRVHRPDVVGLQEPRREQLDDIQERLPAYEFVGVGRRGGEEGEFSPVGYRPGIVEPLDWGTFWLSGTPEEEGSVGWDATYPRIVTWVRFEGPDGTFLVCNTHFDHGGAAARAGSARLLRERVPELAGDDPAVVMGDFNADESSEPYELLAGAFGDARYAAEHGHHGPGDTFHDFTGYPDAKIDHIFVTEGVATHTHAVLPDHWNGRYPSDHFPVLADLSF